MDIIHSLSNILSGANLLYCFVGCFLGTLVGVLPGLSPSSTLAILLPITIYLDSTGSMIMLAGLYYGAMYGGSTTSILVNIPGEPASVVTSIDGFEMTRKGRGGQALWIAAVGSFMAGTIGVIGVSVIGPGLARYALDFGPPEYTGILLFSLTMIISLSGESLLKGMVAGVAGILLATVGMDPLTGTPRLYFGDMGLIKGLDLIPVLVGLFGIGEILDAARTGTKKIYEGPIGKMTPRGEDLRIGLWASLRGSILGFFVGLFPGMGPVLSSFFAYDLEKRISRHPHKFGQGVIEGVAAPEAANNATATAGFIPMMVFGIPIGPALAVILAAMMLHGLQPGPLLFSQHSDFVWTVIGSMYLGNVMLLVLNLPLVGLWARISLIPYKILGPIILAICLVGAYTPRNTLFDVWVALAFGLLGVVMRRFRWPLAPLILGFILGDLLEKALRQTLSMSSGSLMVFLTRPIAALFIGLAILALILMLKYRIPGEVFSEKT